MAKLSKARIAANNRYNEKAYDRINIAVPKGRKDELKAHIQSVRGDGVSLNAWIAEAIEAKVLEEQGDFDKLPESRKWYRSKEGREAIERLGESRSKPE